MPRFLLLLPLLVMFAVPPTASATFPGPAGRILFDRYSGLGGTHPILTMLPNGTSQRQVYSWTSDRRVFDEAYSANGRFLLFGQSTDTRTTLQRMNSAGTGRVVLQSGDSRAAAPSYPAVGAWRSNGEVWFERTYGFTHTDLLAPGGRVVARVFTDSGAGGSSSTGWAFSPDGSRVVYEKVRREDVGSGLVSTQRDLWIIDADGTDDTRLTSFGDLFRGAESMSDVHWSRNGIVYFTAVASGGTDIFLYRIDSDGSDLTAIAREPKGYAVSPDGRTLAFVTNAGVLVAADRFGSNRRVLARNAEAVVMSPDSRRIAYSQDFFGQTDVMTIRIDGTGRLNLTNSSSSEAPIDWARVPPTA